MALSAQVIIDSAKIVEVNNLMSQNPAQFPVATVDKGLLNYLISRENRASANSMLGSIARAKQLIEEALREGNGKTAVFKVQPRFNARKQSLTPVPLDKCDFTGNETAKLVAAQLEISDNIAATAEFDPRVCSPTLPYEMQLANTLQQLYNDFHYQLYAFVLNELARKNANGTYKHIGNSPSRDADMPVLPGKIVNVFKADGDTPNKAAVIALQQDLANAGISPEEGMAWGDSLWDSFARALPGFSQGDGSGFVYSTLRVPFLNQGSFMMNTDVSTIFRAQGLEHPLLIMRPGAVQLVTVPIYTNPLFRQNTGDVIKTTVIVPGLGIEADLTTVIDNCGDYPKWKFMLSVRAALFTLPGCIAEAMSDDFLSSYNGVMLYDGGCGDETFCNQLPFNRVIQSNSSPIADCQVSDVEPCGIPTECSVTLELTYNRDGSLLLTARGVPVPNDTITVYEFSKNGSPIFSGTPSQYFVGAGDWDNGDEFSVAIGTLKECEAVSPTITAESIFPVLRVLEGATTYNNGATISKNDKQGSGNYSVTLNLASITGQDVVVTDIDVTNDGGIAGTSVALPTLPAVIVNPATANIVFTIPRTAIDTVVFTVVIQSNDPANPLYTVNLAVNITA